MAGNSRREKRNAQRRFPPAGVREFSGRVVFPWRERSFRRSHQRSLGYPDLGCFAEIVLPCLFACCTLLS